MATLARRKVRHQNIAAFAPQPAGAAWTPASLGAANRLWIKADTGVILGTGSEVASIADQSGNGFNLTVSGAAFEPPSIGAGYNGHATIDFVSLDQEYLTTNRTTAQAFGMGSQSSWFMAGIMSTGGGSLPSNAQALVYLGATSLAGSGTANYDQTDSVAAIMRETTLSKLCMLCPARAFGASGAVSLDTPMRVLMVFDNTNATLYVNNVQIAQSTATFTLGSSGVIGLGAAIGGSSGTLTRIGAHWYGKMAEVLVTNTALNSTERGQLDAYAAARLA